MSVDTEKGVFKCHNCEYKGSIFEKRIKPQIKKIYIRPEPKFTDLSDKTIKWFANRGISIGCLKAFKIKESNEWMPDKEFNGKMVTGERACINFPYYRNEELVNIKYRDSIKCFRLSKGAELIFFNLDAIKEQEEIVLVEGELDCMAMWEANILNCVSVPNGASKNSRLEYLDNCIDYFTNAKKIILATDNDEAGYGLQKELIRRLGAERCYIVNFVDCKDANEFLLKYGKTELTKIVKEAKLVPIDEIDLGFDIADEYAYYYEHGFPKTVKVGYTEFDKHFSFREGELTIVTGIPSSGKSEFVEQLMVLLAAKDDWRFGVFSPEHETALLAAVLSQTIVGLPFFHHEFKMDKTSVEFCLNFIHEYFYFYGYDRADISVEGILETALKLVRRYGIKGLLIDPYNYIEHHIPKGYTETQYISEVLTKIKRFAVINRIHIILIAHPRKIDKQETKSKTETDEQGNQKNVAKFRVPNLYDINGSANF